MLPAAACAAALAEPRAARLFAFAVYGVGSAICHQLEARSFHLLAEQLPVCARCTGLYAGAAIASLSYLWLAPSRKPGSASAERLTSTARRWLPAAAAPVAASLLLEWTTGVVPSNAIRAATGIVLGGALAYVILAAVDSSGKLPGRA